MKQFAFIISLMLCISCLAQAKDRVIERPPFLAWSSTTLEIDKIVMSDTATVLHIKAYYRPKQWIKIARQSFLKDNNGETYTLKSGIGITPDKEFWMPESGEGEFQLVFPPVADSATAVDFSEGNFDGSFKIWGIQLKSKKLPELVLPAEATRTLESINTLPVPAFKNGNATLKGKVIDFTPGMSGEFQVYTGSCISRNMDNVKIKVQEDGTFSADIPLITISPCIVYINGQIINLILAPNEVTDLFINTRELCRAQSKLRKDEKPEGAKAYYGGYLAALNTELASASVQTSLDGDFNQFIADLKDKNVEEVKAYFLDKSKKIHNEIDGLKVSNACKQILHNQVDLSTANFIAICPNVVQRVHIISNKLSREQAEEYTKIPVETPEGFYDALKDIKNINSPEAIYCMDYGRLVCNPDFGKKYKQALNSDKGIFFELASIGKILSNIQTFTPATDEQIAQIASIGNPVYTELIKSKNDELLKTIEANKKKTGFKINAAGEVSNEDLFASIISKFSGKVILVDFWATWCGPCRMANKAMIPMKEELKGKDIVYLYITGETSPLKTWENMIPDIHGEHFRVTDDQWNYLSKSFQIRGVPTYFIVNQKGDITYKQTGFPGADTMKAELLKVLK